jgi:hypothetical protein
MCRAHLRKDLENRVRKLDCSGSDEDRRFPYPCLLASVALRKKEEDLGPNLDKTLI